MQTKLLITSIAVLVVHSSPAYALGRIQSGVGANGLKWTAANTIIGQTPTGTTPPPGSPNTTPGGGDQIFLAPNSAGYSGVVGMLMTYANGDRFVCSGSLVGNRSVVTAGHCVSGGGGVKATDLVRTQVFFQNDASSALDERVYGLPTGNFPSGVTTIDVSNYTVNAKYTGEVIDQNDISVLTLAELAPAFAQRYEIYSTNDLTGDRFNVTGYGTRSSVGGAAGNTPPANSTTGYRRQGDNVYDYAWGNDALGGFFTDRNANGSNFFGKAEVEYSYVADFDNGLAVQSQSCRIARAVGVSAADANGLGFCTNGLGAREVGIGGGDSGGGAFINGQLASVNSYGLTFGPDFGDFGGGLNSGWGEFSGYVPTFIHADFIRNAIAAVPEPATWAQMLMGFGLIGFATRRRRRLSVVTA